MYSITPLAIVVWVSKSFDGVPILEGGSSVGISLSYPTALTVAALSVELSLKLRSFMLAAASAAFC